MVNLPGGDHVDNVKKFEPEKQDALLKIIDDIQQRVKSDTTTFDSGRFFSYIDEIEPVIASIPAIYSRFASSLKISLDDFHAKIKTMLYYSYLKFIQL